MKHWNLAISSADRATSDPIPQGAPILLRENILDNLAAAAELGYQAIEVHTREDAPLDLDAVNEQIRKTGVKICQIITGRLNTEGKCDLINDKPYIVDAAVKGMMKYVDMAAYVGADLVLGWAKGNIPSGGSREKYMARLAQNLQPINDYAKKKNVKINVEVINHYEVNVFTTAKELVDFLNQYPGLDNCYVHLDSFHMNLEEESFEKAFEVARGRIGYFHIADNSRWYPGSGELDLKRMLELLEKTGYDGYVSVECFPRGDGYATGKKAIEYIRSLE